MIARNQGALRRRAAPDRPLGGRFCCRAHHLGRRSWL